MMSGTAEQSFTSSREVLREAADELLYYMGRATEKTLIIKALKQKARGVPALDPARIGLINENTKNEGKLWSAKVDVDLIFERRGKDVVVLGSTEHIHRSDEPSASPREAEPVLVEGRIKTIDYPKALFSLVAADGTSWAVQYGEGSVSEGCTLPSVKPLVILDFAE